MRKGAQDLANPQALLDSVKNVKVHTVFYMYRPNGWSVTNGYKLVTISETRAGYDVRARMMGVKNLAVRVFPEGRVCVASLSSCRTCTVTN